MQNRDKALEIMENMKKVIIGKDEVLEKVLICLLAQGHLLIEDVPGVGKTTMVKALAKSINLSYSRIQFTTDLMPSDITGLSIYNREEGNFVLKKGPIFNQIILADEINRTSPKTQSSLLQAMEEGEVSIEDHTHELKKPFMVLATQNPLEYQGTFPLPEAQLDRFLMRISLGYPTATDEKNIIRNHYKGKKLDGVSPIANEEDILKIQAEVEEIHVDDAILQYIVGIVNTSRSHRDIHLGASPRASIDLYRSAKALAYLKGRDYVIPDDVKMMAPNVLAHRLILSPEARIEGRKVQEVTQDIIKKTYIPVVKAVEN
ncbi:AAA family ATPase [Alkaliphilus hydrothermalis]|uniref:MoxR-like ATPase n=1 Tax=Alkaliphilus hydrothermalis TaxID=1482730 RepID=A0ABS2NP96_9FIRM|nr:MoxR family ATPase [Alkaliphilus hydrothermalis]MBM7614768.1 MoxR-like ATPase [Alkaliphilus hydrothermalis]